MELRVDMLVSGEKFGYPDDLDPISAEDLKAQAAEVEKVVDADLVEFDAFCVRVLGEPLAPAERAIIKTWLAWKLELHKASVG